MKKLLLPLVCFILLVSWLIGCQQAAPSPAEELKIPAIKVTTPAPRPAWEQKWESVITEAKKEGSVSLYGLWRPETRNMVTQAFKDKYGLNVEFTPFSRGSDLLAKVQAEQRAGLNLIDIFGAGNPTLIVTMKPEKLLGPIAPLLILPEVMDPNGWRGGKIPLTDKDGTAFSLIGVIIRTIYYNTDMVKEGEITSHKDLLKPQYKGKITLNDPSVTGAGNAVIAHLGHTLWGEAETTEFLRKLIKDQEVVIQRDNRVHMESVARGKYAIAFAPVPDLAAEFVTLKAPVKAALIEEDNRMTSATGAFGVPTKFAHPNAALVFINWLLTREGQTVFSKSFGNASTRIDVPVEGFDPLTVPMAGKKYYLEDEEALASRGKWLEIAQKVIAETAK